MNVEREAPVIVIYCYHGWMVKRLISVCFCCLEQESQLKALKDTVHICFSAVLHNQPTSSHRFPATPTHLFRYSSLVNSSRVTFQQPHAKVMHILTPCNSRQLRGTAMGINFTADYQFRFSGWQSQSQVPISQPNAPSVTPWRGVVPNIITTKDNSRANRIAEVAQNNNMSKYSRRLCNLCYSSHSIARKIRPNYFHCKGVRLALVFNQNYN